MEPSSSPRWRRCGLLLSVGLLLAPGGCAGRDEVVPPPPAPADGPDLSPVPSPAPTTRPGGRRVLRVPGRWRVPDVAGPAVVASGWQDNGGVTSGGLVVRNNGPALASLEVTVRAREGASLAGSAVEVLRGVPAGAWTAVDVVFVGLSPRATVEVVDVVGVDADPGATGPAYGGVTASAEIPTEPDYYGDVPVVLRNPGPGTLPGSAELTVLVLDGRDRIVSSQHDYTARSVPAGGSVTEVVPDVWLPAGAASVVASVDQERYEGSR